MNSSTGFGRNNGDSSPPRRQALRTVGGGAGGANNGTPSTEYQFGTVINRLRETLNNPAHLRFTDANGNNSDAPTNNDSAINQPHHASAGNSSVPFASGSSSFGAGSHNNNPTTSAAGGRGFGNNNNWSGSSTPQNRGRGGGEGNGRGGGTRSFGHNSDADDDATPLQFLQQVEAEAQRRSWQQWTEDEEMGEHFDNLRLHQPQQHHQDYSEPSGGGGGQPYEESYRIPAWTTTTMDCGSSGRHRNNSHHFFSPGDDDEDSVPPAQDEHPQHQQHPLLSHGGSGGGSRNSHGYLADIEDTPFSPPHRRGSKNSGFTEFRHHGLQHGDVHNGQQGGWVVSGRTDRAQQMQERRDQQNFLYVLREFAAKEVNSTVAATVRRLMRKFQANLNCTPMLTQAPDADGRFVAFTNTTSQNLLSLESGGDQSPTAAKKHTLLRKAGPPIKSSQIEELSSSDFDEDDKRRRSPGANRKRSDKQSKRRGVDEFTPETVYDIAKIAKCKNFQDMRMEERQRMRNRRCNDRDEDDHQDPRPGGFQRRNAPTAGGGGGDDGLQQRIAGLQLHKKEEEEDLSFVRAMVGSKRTQREPSWMSRSSTGNATQQQQAPSILEPDTPNTSNLIDCMSSFDLGIGGGGGTVNENDDDDDEEEEDGIRTSKVPRLETYTSGGSRYQQPGQEGGVRRNDSASAAPLLAATGSDGGSVQLKLPPSATTMSPPAAGTARAEGSQRRKKSQARSPSPLAGRKRDRTTF